MTRSRSISITPTWAGIMPALLELIRQNHEPSATIAREEIMRLARLADSFGADASSGIEIKVKK
jgi:hypothetical protein